MRYRFVVPLTVSLLVIPMDATHPQAGSVVRLPAPAADGAVSVEAALRARRSIRSFQDEELTLAQLGQLLWAAQGVNIAVADQLIARQVLELLERASDEGIAPFAEATRLADGAHVHAQ